MISIMCLDAKWKFLTFVLVAAVLADPSIGLTAPPNDLPPKGIILNDDHEYFFPRKPINDTTDFGLGTAQGVFDKSKEQLSLGFYTLGRSHYQDNKTAYDYKLILTSSTLLGVDAGYRWVFPEILKDEPYVKVGAVILIDPKDQLANFIDYERYYLQAGLGFDNLFKTKRAIKIEFGARAGAAGTHAYAHIAYGLAD
jgi:hypothetical protein